MSTRRSPGLSAQPPPEPLLWLVDSLESVEIAVCLLDRGHNLAWANEAADLLLGLRPEDLGKAFPDALFHRLGESAPGIAMLEPMLRSAYAEGAEVANVSIPAPGPALAPGMHQREIRYSSVPAAQGWRVELAEGFPPHLETRRAAFAYQEVAPQARQRTVDLTRFCEAAGRAQRLATLGQLAADVVHDILNPLTTVRSSIFLVSQHLHDAPPAVQRALERAERNIVRCEALVRQILDAGRAGGNRDQGTPPSLGDEE